MKLLEGSLWLYVALAILGFGRGTTAEDVHPFHSTEGLAAAVHAAPLSSAEFGAVRATPPGWTGARLPIDAAWLGVRWALQTPSWGGEGATHHVGNFDVVGIPLGFLAERSLAPPHLG
ncbi:MAG: hypothetical protein AB7T31_14255 [Gemmatimonadales bacterium]